ncbi:uncharacterized protein [Antedon mediterranea]|uniref:uncharacterized protein n=1 Tax=Antedon mediterranea TaxID=105859 RepID=UPI003AF42AF9
MADTEIEKKENLEHKETEIDTECSPKQTDVPHDDEPCNISDEKEATKTSSIKDSTPICDTETNDNELLKKYEEMFKNRFTELDPMYLKLKDTNDAECIPIVENFRPPWNPQNRDGGRGRGHGSHHHQQNRYKRRHEEYRSHDNRWGRDSYHSKYRDERQNQYHGSRHNERSNYESRDQGYRRY